MALRLFNADQDAEIARRYLAGESARALGVAFQTDHGIIRGSLRRSGIVTRDAAERNRLYPINARAFDSIETEAQAYWLGFLFADGSVGRRSLVVGLAAVDREHLRNLGQMLESTAPIHETIVGKGHAVVTATFTDEHLTDRLRELGIIPHRPDPLATFNAIPAELLSHWIRGFFDGDGSIKMKAVAEFCGAHPLLERIRETLAPAVGRQGSLYPHSKSAIWYLSYAGRPSCLALAEYLYHDATIFLERKRHRFDTLPAPAANWWERVRDNGRWKSKDKPTTAIPVTTR